MVQSAMIFTVSLVRALLCLSLFCATIQLSPAHVLRVVDGDTFILAHVGIPPEERVRVLGVDTPERGQLNYEEARIFTESWVRAGNFSLTTCQRDSFGRLLSTVTRGPDDLSRALLDAGLAVPYHK